MIKYFAYGSNMNPSRMADRDCEIFAARKGYIRNYDITFDKRSKNLINTGFANIKPSDGNVVEGVLYEISNDSLKNLDKCEGFPKHYQRVRMIVCTEQGEEVAEVYVASPEWITEGLRPSKEYIKHLLEAKDILSDDYFKRLKSILTTDI